MHGGMGYIEETGAAQHYRDARIAPIYEGTNGIQAIDLVTRKAAFEWRRDGLRLYRRALRETVRGVKAANESAFGQTSERLEASVAALEDATGWLLRTLPENRNAALAGATPFLRLFGIACGGTYLAKGALSAMRGSDVHGAQPEAKVLEARHFAENLMGETEGLKHAVSSGHETVSRAETVLGLR